jgi:hypothetical protein
MTKYIIQQAATELAETGLPWNQAYRAMYEVYGLLAAYEAHKAAGHKHSFLSTLD